MMTEGHRDGPTRRRFRHAADVVSCSSLPWGDKIRAYPHPIFKTAGAPDRATSVPVSPRREVFHLADAGIVWMLLKLG